MSKEETSFDY